MPDTMRVKYRELNDDEQAMMDRIKTEGQLLYDQIGRAQSQGCGVRESNLAMMKVEEAVMWAVKAIIG